MWKLLVILVVNMRKIFLEKSYPKCGGEKLMHKMK